MPSTAHEAIMDTFAPEFSRFWLPAVDRDAERRRDDRDDEARRAAEGARGAGRARERRAQHRLIRIRGPAGDVRRPRGRRARPAPSAQPVPLARSPPPGGLFFGPLLLVERRARRVGVDHLGIRARRRRSPRLSVASRRGFEMPIAKPTVCPAGTGTTFELQLMIVGPFGFDDDVRRRVHVVVRLRCRT